MGRFLRPLRGHGLGLYYSLEAATSEQVDAFLEDLRPDVNQVPPRDLSVTEIRPLSEIEFEDSVVFGAKAANVAELRRILPTGQCPDGYTLMSQAQIYELADLLEQVQSRFARLYKKTSNPDFAMEVEFKITAEGILVIKQARP